MSKSAAALLLDESVLLKNVALAVVLTAASSVTGNMIAVPRHVMILLLDPVLRLSESCECGP